MSWIAEKALAERLQRELNPAVDAKPLLNWLSKAKEIPLVKFKNRRGYDSEDVSAWVTKLQASLISLEKSDYFECLRFAVEGYYKSITKSDFNRSKQRDLGEFITNQIEGKLGEIAVQKLLRKHGLDTKLDFEVSGEIPSQDITQVSERLGVWNNPAKKLSIKSTKLKNFLLAVPQNEITLSDRMSDIYVLSLVGIFPDHILRLLKGRGISELADVEALIPSFESITCRVAGWISRTDLLSLGPMTPAEIQSQFGVAMASQNYVRTSGQLSSGWPTLVDLLKG